MIIRITFMLVAAAGLAACAGSNAMNARSATEQDFGNSVASLVKAQTADPSTLSSPSTEPVTGVDGDYVNNVINAMRENVAKPAEVKQPIELRVGGQGGQGGS
jgi:hypothetical protein